ncbi:tetratricopeptide repeat protein [Niabella hibiscisoli]|uniref:tetratricopeptide repeat protein n=1 Tax=Niabella hibiscisoli TaxID=1825928 RepID=UPI001F0F5FBA|nr:tetratricopeptide repeat protein [Niabella hibiscisoli]MCH5715349.1 tetratricopeptide repeat protein [Niabella hibiscisoli]
MTPKLNFITLIAFVFLTAIFSCAPKEKQKDGERTEMGQSGLVAVTVESSTHYAEYQEASKLLQEGKALEAIRVYKHLCKIEDERLKTYCYMGLASAYLVLANYSEAIKNYNKSLKLNGKNFNSYIGLGSTYFSIKDYKKAIEHYDYARKMNPKSPDCYWGLALAYDKQNNIDSAKANVKQFLALEPNSKYRNFAEMILMK